MANEETPVVMNEETLLIAEGMGISYSEAEDEMERVYMEQAIEALEPKGLRFAMWKALH